MDLEFYLGLVKVAAAKSKDTAMGVGAVLIDKHGNTLLTGFNEFPDGLEDLPERRTRPEKYTYTEHAERNVIYAAAKRGYKLDGATIVQSWFPCADCARAIVQSGIKTIYCEKPDFEDHRWGTAFRASAVIFRECGIEVVYY